MKISCLITYLFASLVVILLAQSCVDKTSLYEQSKSIKSRTWRKDSIPKFDFKIVDASARYEIWLGVRHDKQYQFNDFNYRISIQDNTNSWNKTYEGKQMLASRDGRWLSPTAGNLYSKESLVLENFVFPDTGKFSLLVEQSMPSDPLTGITDIRYKIYQMP